MSEQSSALKAAPKSGRREPGSSPSAQGTDDNFVQIVDVVKKFGETVAVRGVDLSVKKGELFALLGSSGLRQVDAAAHARRARIGDAKGRS